jgi:fatty acid desaturase
MFPPVTDQKPFGPVLSHGNLDHRVRCGLRVADFLLLLLGAVAVYVLVELKRMLFERYSYRGLDVIIAVAIAWTVVNYGGSFALQSYFGLLLFPVAYVALGVAFLRPEERLEFV